MPTSTLPARRAFTLIELLAVIAIIGIVAGITITAASKVRHGVNLTRSASNLRQIGAAFFLYAADHGNRTPGAGQNTMFIIDSTLELTNNNRIIHRDLAPYLGDSHEIWHSPADSAFYRKFHNGRATSYAHALGDFVGLPTGGYIYTTESVPLALLLNGPKPPDKRPLFAEADWEITLPTVATAAGDRINDRYNVFFLGGNVARYDRTATQGRYRSDW